MGCVCEWLLVLRGMLGGGFCEAFVVFDFVVVEIAAVGVCATDWS